jgi:phosphoglycolate phosphatase-like HAD superfamily hydrolase
MKPIRHIIFDWSGTLANDYPVVLHATNEIFKHYGKPTMSDEEFREKFFLPFTEFYDRYLPKVTLEELDVLYHQFFNPSQHLVHALPYAYEMLQYCQKKGIDTFLLSSIHDEHYRVQSAQLNMAHYFKEAFVRVIDKRLTIQELINKHQLDPQATLFVGDMQHDIEAARAGGVRSCAVLTGYDSLEKLRASEPDLMFRDLSGLLEWLQSAPSADMPVATVGALIFNPKDEVLMIRTFKWNNCWGMPGGKVNYGETCQQAVLREIQEETGLSLRDVQLLLVQDVVEPVEFYRPAHFILLCYTARSESTKVTLNTEADEFQWISPEKALSFSLNQPSRSLIEHYLKTQNL